MGKFEPNVIYQGEMTTGLTQIRYYPIPPLPWTFAKYRMEINNVMLYKPVNVEGNVPHWSTISWKKGSGRLFNGTVYYWVSPEEFQAGYATKYIDFRTGSAYAGGATLKVKDMYRFNYAMEGIATLTIKKSGPGGPNTI